jgi:hypothetical protein
MTKRSYEVIAPPVTVTLTCPYTNKRLRGQATARTKELDPKWFKVRVASNATPLAYHKDECQIHISRPPFGDEGLVYGRRVVAPVDPTVPVFAPTDAIDETATELFAGCGRLSDAIEATCAVDYCTRVDYATHYDSGVCLNADIGALSAVELKKLLSVRFIHLSPTCSTYSRLASSVHKRTWANNYLGVTQMAWKANGLLLRLFHALRARQAHPDPAIITIENPLAAFHLTPIVRLMQEPFDKGGLGLTLLEFSFCAHGETWRKQSVLLTNSPTLIDKYGDDKYMCRASMCRFTKRRHTQITRRADGGVETNEVTPFPPLLCKRIAKAVVADLA